MIVQGEELISFSLLCLSMVLPQTVSLVVQMNVVGLWKDLLRIYLQFYTGLCFMASNFEVGKNDT